MSQSTVYILAASRTPMGSYGGVLAELSAPELGALVVKDALFRTQVSPQLLETIVMGDVLSANLGQAPARQASMLAGLPEHICATTVNKVCASGMKAIRILANEIQIGDCSVGIAGGMESMSNVPHYLPHARFGVGYGTTQLVDGLAKDGLTDVYNQTSMGVSGDKTAEKYRITRQQQDDFAEQSYRRSAEAWADGSFAEEVVPVEIPQKQGNPLVVTEDEGYKKANFEKMRQLKPAFTPTGTGTPANTSPLSDGASALVLASEAFIQMHALKPLARIVAYAEAEQEPLFFTTTPVLATQKVLKKAQLSIHDIDYFEVNEAFSVVPLTYMGLLGVPVDKVNVYGGAVALGHPLGSSGSRIVVTLLHVLQSKKVRFGLATICNGGGGASALIIERL